MVSYKNSVIWEGYIESGKLPTVDSLLDYLNSVQANYAGMPEPIVKTEIAGIHKILDMVNKDPPQDFENPNFY